MANLFVVIRVYLGESVAEAIRLTNDILHGNITREPRVWTAPLLALRLLFLSAFFSSAAFAFDSALLGAFALLLAALLLTALLAAG